MIPRAVLNLGLIIYTGFTIPTTCMPGWSRWMAYLNPLAYSFEAIMANDFHGREFACAGMVRRGPGYEGLPETSRICAVVEAAPESRIVDGGQVYQLVFRLLEQSQVEEARHSLRVHHRLLCSVSCGCRAGTAGKDFRRSSRLQQESHNSPS